MLAAANRIGVDANGKLLLVTVDGRQKGSVGMTPVAFARFFQWLGATSALNLDGGGSTTMWVRGSIVNKVSGSYERPVGSSVLVFEPSHAVRAGAYDFDVTTFVRREKSAGRNVVTLLLRNAAGGALKLAGVQKRVETMLTMTGAQNFIEVHPDEPSAVKSFGA